MRLNLIFFENEQKLDVRFGDVQKITEYIEVEKYEGDYEVVPKIDSQTLPTKDKLLVADVKIKSIPVVKVSNTGGGNTVIIGG